VRARLASPTKRVGKFALLNAHQSVFILLFGFFAEMSLASADAGLVDTRFGKRASPSPYGNGVAGQAERMRK